MSPLETSPEAPPVPGSNMKGSVAGANWWFLLPSLRAERIVCLGSPTPAALATLGRMSDDVIVCAFWHENATCDDRGYRTRNEGWRGRENDTQVNFTVRLQYLGELGAGP